MGPGDPELLTVKAQRIVAAVDVIAYPNARHGRSVARAIAAPHFRGDQIEVALEYPVTTEQTDHPGGYEAALSEFYDAAAAQLAVHLDAGRDVAVLCEGDPFFYGSYMYLHERLAHRYATEVVPGVTSFSAAAAAAGTPLVRRDDILTVLPGTLPPDVLAARLRASDAAVVIKLGRTFPGVRRRGRAGGRGRARRSTSSAPAATPSASRRSPRPASEVPYMSLVLVPSAVPARAQRRGPGRVSVVGLGPAGPDWLTPEAHAELAAAEELIGYETYLARVPERRGQRRHATDNRVEAERARHALELAAGGARVAVVSSGDPGIFAMAAAVLEVVDGDVALGGRRGADRAGPLGDAGGRGPGRRAARPRLLRRSRCRTSSSRGRSSSGASTRPARPTSSLALYNPASRTRREQLARAVEVLRSHRADATPVVVARAVGAPEESVSVTTLGELDLDVVDMRTLLIVGSSTTRMIAGEPPRVYTPRRYPA